MVTAYNSKWNIGDRLNTDEMIKLYKTFFLLESFFKIKLKLWLLAASKQLLEALKVWLSGLTIATKRKQDKQQ